MPADLNLSLRPTTPADLDILFLFQLDPQAIQMAAFTPKDPADKEAYISKYTRLLNDPTINNQTILLDDVVAGSIAKFIMEDVYKRQPYNTTVEAEWKGGMLKSLKVVPEERRGDVEIMVK